MTETTNGIPTAVRLHEALAAAGLPVTGVGRDRITDAVRVDWGEPPSKAQEDEAQVIIAGFDPAPSKMERLAQAGFGAERLLTALWEKVVEGDNSMVEAVMTKLKG
ncbi:MAG: hypothetical protein RBT34_06110 [Anaerolineaceae bacterium]|jgi:hypothetical protein|nr:hypothetical protein [Anaerolineaceae bacterium]